MRIAGARWIWDGSDRAGYYYDLRARKTFRARAGDRTTWEMFAEFGHGDRPTRSRCHPYATLVVQYLVKHLLGIQPAGPGFQTVSVRPRPPTGINQCRGAIPTPHGLIRVGWERSGGRLDLKVEIPKGARRV